MRITWIYNIGGQRYVAVRIKGAARNLGPLRPWQRHIGALQQHKGRIRGAVGRRNGQHRPADSHTGNGWRRNNCGGDVTHLKQVDLRAGVGSRRRGVQDQSLSTGTVGYKCADNILSGSASVGSKTQWC